MSSTGKIITGVIIVVVLVGAYMLIESHPATTAMAPDMTGTTTTDSTGSLPAATTTTDLTTASSDDSDAALQQDSATINGQMSGLNSDNADTDSSMNDQAGTQSY
jgi:hypothetical protein